MFILPDLIVAFCTLSQKKIYQANSGNLSELKCQIQDLNMMGPPSSTDVLFCSVHYWGMSLSKLMTSPKKWSSPVHPSENFGPSRNSKWSSYMGLTQVNTSSYLGQSYHMGRDSLIGSIILNVPE